MNSVNVENALINERARIRTEIELIKAQLMETSETFHTESIIKPVIDILDQVIDVVEKKPERVIQI